MTGRFVHGPTRLCRWNRTIERIRASSSHRTPTRWKYLIKRWAGSPRLTSICPYSPARARSSIADDIVPLAGLAAEIERRLEVGRVKAPLQRPVGVGP